MRNQTLEIILKPSPIHGVGVFTLIRWDQGDKLPFFRDWTPTHCPLSRIELSYSYKENGYIFKPSNWHRMSICWYLNHSETPNVDAKSLKCLRDIAPDEELTIDYRLYEGELNL